MQNGVNDLRNLILSALAKVREPTGKNLAEMDLLAGVNSQGATLFLMFKDPGWPPPIRERISAEIKGAIQKSAPGFQQVQIDWGGHEPAKDTGPRIKHVVAVGSGKGGVGKSTIAASIAYALKLKGHVVGLMDADVYGPSIPHMLGVSGRPTVANNRYSAMEKDGIKTISMGFLVPAGQAVVWRGPMLHKAVHDFLYSVDWGPLDYLIVDLPPGTGDVVLSLSQQMPLAGGVIVCTPQDVALLDARKALHMLETVKIPCLGIVENMSFFECPQCSARTDIFGHGGAERWAKEIAVPFLGAVPINLAIRINGDDGKIRDNFADDGPVRRELLSIADRLIDQISQNAAPPTPRLEIV